MAGKLHVTKAQALAEGEKRPLLKDIHVSVNRHDPTSSALSGLGDRYPSQDATCISSALFSWVTPLMELGNQRPLEHDDLYLLDPVNRAHEVSTEFQEAWKKQCSKPSGKPSLSWALASCFGGQIAKAGLLKLVHDSLQFVGPMLIKEIIAYLQNPDAPLSEGLIYAGIVFVSGVMQSFLLRNYFFHCFEAGMRVRSAVCTAVYTKSLVLSAAARQKKTTGEITNLMSIDAQRLQELSTYINSVWFSIFQIVVACYLLWKQIGPATFAGVAVIILMLPVTAGISKLMRRLQLKLMGVKDERIKICNEVLAGMKVIKLQAWEHSFTKRVLEYRSEELSKLRTYIYARSGSMTLFSAIPSFVTVASFYTYVKLGNTLDVGTALTSLALFNILRFPLFMLPQVLNSIVEATVSIDRLSSYFQEEEREKVGPGDLDGVGVRVNNADFMWDTAPRASSASEASTGSKEEDSLLQEDSILDKEALGGGDSLPVLQRVSVEARPGDLIAVVGHVGAGKSTLLSGILGDARCSRGDVSLRGSVAYVSQQPFIQNATVRENICFGLPFNEAKYAEALRVSSMQKDLAVLPGGDMTEIGEKGINLSGGQRTRVALARAVYQDADIYLLDDILSAVDSHVGHDIFKECIKTCLKDKLVILVTHGLTFLSECDNIVVLENGVIRENGTYEDLMEKDGGLLMDLVAKYKDQDEQEPHTIEDDISVDELEEVEEDNPTPERLDRRLSRSSVRSERSLSEAGMDAQLMTDEDRSVGDVAWQVYKTWIVAFGGVFAGLVVIFIFIATQCVNLLSTWWLSFWSEHSQPKDGPANKESEMFYVYIYMALNLVYAVALYIRAITTYKGGLRASKSLFQNLLARILRAPTSFFDTTPTGRIVNRLSKDVYTVDESIPATWSMLLNTFISVLVTLATISYVTPIFMVILLPVLVGYYISQRYFIKSSRELQRLDSISRSPVFALLSETLDGLPTIRAYRAETQFSTKNEELIDRNQRAYFLNFAVNCWLALRLEFAGTLIAAFAALTAVLAHSSDPERGAAFAGLAGVSLTYAFSVTQSLNWSVRMLSQLQTQMVSVERIKNYTVMDMEAELTSVGKLPPAQEWPSAGAIEFRNVNLRYRPGLPRVLRNLSLSIRPQEKIGIVGRTGAGKSSLVVALMRLVELDSGSIVIDGLDISTIGLHELRNKISIIPQDPVLFSGTVRSNVDPFDQYTDEQIWTSLRRGHLAHVVSALDSPVDEKGSNFSVGERQLLCIARALLKRSRIILMDEATASIDTETDRKIQRSIREEFRDCTCLTIAHRINTILDADRILVMERGAVGEFDTPKALQKKQDGLFKALVEHWKNEGGYFERCLD
ncbi:Multidrug resistance-associated protein 1 [Phytophthora cactorum]|nr:Multidrug resistance-associated protein 1 [Phytophthora cactorum]